MMRFCSCWYSEELPNCVTEKRLWSRAWTLFNDSLGTLYSQLFIGSTN